MNKNDECIICLDQIKDYDYVILSCKHMIHYNCLETWINTKKDYVKMCPICDTPSEVENIIIPYVVMNVMCKGFRAITN